MFYIAVASSLYNLYSDNLFVLNADFVPLDDVEGPTLVDESDGSDSSVEIINGPVLDEEKQCFRCGWKGEVGRFHVVSQGLKVGVFMYVLP